MKMRNTLLVAAACALFAAPVVSAQSGPAVLTPEDIKNATGGLIGPFRGPGIPNQPEIKDRVFISGHLKNAADERIGKIQAGSGLRNGILVQGVKIRIKNVVPSAEFGLYLDGKFVGTALSNGAGTLRMAFVNPPTGPVPTVPETVGVVTSAQIAQITHVTSGQVVATAELKVRSRD